MATIEITIRPYSWRREEIQVGRMVAGCFVQERGIWNVLKDPRLSVKRIYDGRGAQTEVTFAIQVPDGYDMVIAKYSITDVNKTSPDKKIEVLFDPFANPELLEALAHAFDGLVEAIKAKEAGPTRTISGFERDEPEAYRAFWKKIREENSVGTTTIGFYDDEREEWVEDTIRINLSDPDYSNEAASYAS